mmetsp:Transcript_3619/g.10287  ORF Transcript_3619/g.10287 Transcript_3619/m.10287 type:complete len:207 (+) Transcript_3619:472-1092(+)
MMLGGTPTTLYDLQIPTMGSPRRSASARLIMRTAAAPSVSWLEFPAVVEPAGSNAGRSLDSPWAVVPGRIPSSSVTMVPSANVTGIISSRNLPAIFAAWALPCDSAAKASNDIRSIPYFLITFSLVMPMGIKQSMASSFPNFSCWRLISSQSTSGGGMRFIGCVLILSTPQPIPISICPDAMALAMLAQACRPEEHCRLVVDRLAV